MLIRMKSTHLGSRDGAIVERFSAGATVDLGATARELELATVFLREGWAEKVEARETVEPRPVDTVQAARPPQVHGKGRR